MIYAIAKISGKQYRIAEDEELAVDRINAPVGKVIDIKEILMVAQGENRLIGEDTKKAKIKAKIIEDYKDKKVLVLKYKKRKRYRKLTGHRQQKTTLLIESIDFPGKKAEKKKPVAAKKKIVETKKTDKTKKSVSKEADIKAKVKKTSKSTKPSSTKTKKTKTPKQSTSKSSQKDSKKPKLKKNK